MTALEKRSQEEAGQVIPRNGLALRKKPVADPFLFTGSGLDRLDKCVAAGVLPRSHSLEENPAARFGTVVHSYLARVPVVGREEALAEVPAEHRDACDAIDLSVLPASEPEAWAPEVAFRYDVATSTAVELWRGENRRDYTAAEGVVFGTLDTVGLTEELALVVDYKTGQALYPPAKEVWQLKFGALAAARAFDKDGARVAICRIRDDGTPWFDWAEFSAMELDAIEREVAQLVRRVELSREQVVPHLAETTTGPHCCYCPSRPYCPAMARMAAVIGRPETSANVFPAALTVEVVPAVLERIELFEGVLEDAKKQVRKFAAENTVPLPNGWAYGRKMHPETVIDPEKAVPLLEQLYGADVASAALKVESKIVQEDLRKALRLWVNRTPGAKITKVFSSAMQQLKEQGAAEVVPIPRVMKFRLPKVAPAEAAPELPAESSDGTTDGSGTGEEEAPGD